MSFIGRKKELEQLQSLLKKNSSSLVVIKGRRRIGKSRLIEEFGKHFSHVYLFSGVPPTEKTSMQNELHAFGWQLGKALNEPAFKDSDWNDLFLRLSKRVQRGKVLVLLDEISWMGSKDPHFLGKLKTAWDLEFKKNAQLVLVLCGSVSTWIEKNILSHTGFLGRISLTLTIEELPFFDCNQFWLKYADKISSFEKFKILSVTGGVPKYLEEIKPQLTAEENIKQLCFDKSGLLYNEFEQIFSDLFAKRSSLYKEIVQSISNGPCEYSEIYKKLGLEKTSVVGEYLDDLVQSGFIQRDYTWHLKNGDVSKLSRFRVSDNYLRFYLKYILPNKDRIARGSFENFSLSLLPGWETVMGLQFENMVLNNRKKIQELLFIKPEDVIYDNPFFQNKTARQEGCQIDYLIQTRHDTLYLCEIKFLKYPVKTSVISEVRQKISRLKIPRHISLRTVLIHVNGVSDAVLEDQFFADTIDFSQLLKK